MPELPFDLERFDLEWKKGSRTRAVKLAKEYIEADYQRFGQLLGGKTVEELVQMVDGYRAQGDEVGRIIVDMWLVGDFAHAAPPPMFIDAPHLEDIPDELSLQRMEHCGKMQRHDQKREVAAEYVAANREWMAPVLAKLTQPELVRLVDIRREEGFAMEALVIEAWILAEYEPQHITGQMQTGLSTKALEAAFKRMQRHQRNA